MQKLFFWTSIFLFLTAQSFGENSEFEYLKTAHAQLLIRDGTSAEKIVDKGISQLPQSYPLLFMKIKSCAVNKDEQKLLQTWQVIKQQFPEKAYQSELLEEICWAIVKKGNQESALSVRIIALLGAAITQSAEAIPILLGGMSDSSIPIRAVSIEMASHYGDQPLKEKIIQLLHQEHQEEVRLKLVEAIANLHLTSLTPYFFSKLKDLGVSLEEKEAIIAALAMMDEKIERNQLEELIKSPRATLRILGAECIAQLQLKEEADLLYLLLEDRNMKVRASAIKGLGLMKIHSLHGKSIIPLIQKTAEAGDPRAGVTAAWALLLIDPSKGESLMEKFLSHPKEEVVILAASAIATAGSYGVPLAKKWIEKIPNSYAKANLAIGLIRQRQHLDEACRVIDILFQNSSEKWMWKKEVQGLFTSLQKSNLKHNGLIPNFPEVSSQAVHLDLLNLLAICEYPKAFDRIKDYMLKRTWQITGIAAELLLNEGDESVIELMRELLNDSHSQIKLDAALALAIWGKNEEALPTLMKLYPSADKITKIKILEALARIGNREVIPFFMEQLQSPSRMLRIVSAACIIMALNQ